MENKLIFMKAYIDRFNIIRAYLKKSYYEGKCQKFYLKNLSTQKLEDLRTVLVSEQENEVVYQFMVDNIHLEDAYELINEYGMAVPIEPRMIVNDPLFDLVYGYDKKDLGPHYTKEKTSFKVWSPTSLGIILHYQLKGKAYFYKMERLNQGVYFIEIAGDLEGAKYYYEVCYQDHYELSLDPYAYGSSANGKESIVVDPSKFQKIIKVKETLKQKTDAIIYEMSVRDFTSQLDIPLKSTFLGCVQSNLKTKQGKKAGIDYLVDMGYTHVQLMPIADFATVDEQNPTLFYNWGYDPMQFNVPEGSYASNNEDPYSRINDCIAMINTFHQRGLRVVMDVVYNHVYDVNRSSFEKLVPHYFFRNDDYGNISNGSFCSNDLNSESKMVRKYILDMCERWQKVYGVDGYRFDLMGILDVDTLNLVEKQAREYDPSFLVYGEGWNMNTMLPDFKKAMKDNYYAMHEIGFFNDVFRDHIKGTSFGDQFVPGYLLGNQDQFLIAKKVVENKDVFIKPEQSINYIECHDNATAFDLLTYSLKMSEEETCKRMKLLNTLVVLAQGIPFIHSGQEFCRTKQGDENSYRSGDQINGLDWNRKDEFEDQIYFMRNLIKLRKENKGFRYASNEQIKQNVDVSMSNHSLIYTIRQDEGKYKQIKVIINPSLESDHYSMDSDEEILITSEIAEKMEYGHLLLQKLSVYILGKKS